LILFIGILIIFSQENMDYVAYSLLFAFIACVLTSFMIPIDQVAEHLPWVDSSQITGSTWLIANHLHNSGRI